jgi:membrane protein required for colicin V production
MKVAVIDVVFLILVLILVFRCTLRGFIKELMTMASAVLGVLIAVLLYKPGAAFIRTKILSDVAVLPELIAFIVLIAIVSIVIKILEGILQDIISRVNLGGLNHILGLVFGLLEGLLLVCLILFVINIQTLFNPDNLLEKSLFAKYLAPLVAPLGGDLSFPKLPNGPVPPVLPGA